MILFGTNDESKRLIAEYGNPKELAGALEGKRQEINNLRTELEQLKKHREEKLWERGHCGFLLLSDVMFDGRYWDDLWKIHDTQQEAQRVAENAMKKVGICGSTILWPYLKPGWLVVCSFDGSRLSVVSRWGQFVSGTHCSSGRWESVNE